MPRLDVGQLNSFDAIVPTDVGHGLWARRSGAQTVDRAVTVGSQTIVFVDAAVDDYQSLLAGQVDTQDETTRVFILDSNRDGLRQMTSALRRFDSVDAVHIVSHGQSGALQLGNSTLDSDDFLQSYGSQRVWRDRLTDGADIFLYGCDVASGPAGQEFVQRFGRFADADVAASTNATGTVSLGGDWTLEHRQGVIEQTPLFTARTPKYTGLLVTQSGTTATVQNADLNSTQTITLGATIETLDVSAIADRLLVTVRADNSRRNQILVQKMDSLGNGTGAIATFITPSTSKTLSNLVVGASNQKVRLVLDGELEKLDLAKVTGAQVALGRKSIANDPYIRLTQNNGVSVAFGTKGGLKTLVVGKANDATQTHLSMGRDVQIETLKKGTSYNGKLKLDYPDGDSGDDLTRTVDLRNTLIVRGFGSLDGFVAGDVREVITGDGRQEVVVGSITPVTVRGGDGNDVLVGGGNAQELEGQGGDDILIGDLGPDTLRGGAGNDRLIGGSGIDTLDGGADDDTYVFENAQWGTGDTIIDASGSDSLDFSTVDARLTVTLGNTLSVTADKEVVPSLNDQISLGSKEDAVTLPLANTPHVTIAANQVQGVANTALTFNMGANVLRDSITVNSPSSAQVEARINELAAATPLNGIRVKRVASDVRLQVDQQVIAVQSGNSWNRVELYQGMSELRLSPLLPTPSHEVVNGTERWTFPVTTLTLAVGDFKKNATVADYDAGSFDVTFFNEAPWTGGYNGTYSELMNEWRSYMDTRAEELIQTAVARRDLLKDNNAVDQIATELWTEAIEQEITTTFLQSTNKTAHVGVIQTDNGARLSVHLNGHNGDIAVAPAGVTIPATLANNLSTVPSVSTTSVMERFVAPSSNQAEVDYVVQTLTRDFQIDFGGTEAHSTLNLSALNQEIELHFTGAGQVEVRAISGGNTTATLKAAGIGKIELGSGKYTFFVSESGSSQAINVINGQNATGERHLVIDGGFTDTQVILNNSNQPFVIGEETYAGNSLRFVGRPLVEPNLSGMAIASVRAGASFQGDLYVKGVAHVFAGTGDDLVELPSAATLDLSDGDDTLIGSDEDDVIRGGNGADLLHGNDGADTLLGGKGTDEFWGGPGNDALTGGADSDIYHYDATGWGIDTIVEKAGEGNQDLIDFSELSVPMVHVISGNNYHGFTGSDLIADSNARLNGQEASTGAIQLYDVNGDTWSAFDPANPAHVDANADRVSVTAQQFQNVEELSLSQGANTFYFGNEWGPSDLLGAAAGTFGGPAGAWLASSAQSLLSGEQAAKDRTLEIDTSQTSSLILDFRQVTEELNFSFEPTEDGSTTLVVTKTQRLELPLVGSLSDEVIQYNAIRFSHVDENTTLFGGREANTFVLKGDATFDGTVIGGEGFRSWVGELLTANAPSFGSIADAAANGPEVLGFLANLLSNAQALLGGDLPDVFVTNVVDQTQAAVFPLKTDSVWDAAQASLNELFHESVLEASGGDSIAVQRLQAGPQSIDLATQHLAVNGSVASLKLTYDAVTTDLITLGGDAATNRAAINAALTSAAIPFNVATGDGTSADPWDFSFTGGNAAELIDVQAFSDAAGNTSLVRFGALFGDASASPEIQTLVLLDPSAQTIELTLGNETVTWTRSNAGFLLTDFGTANDNGGSPRIPLASVSGSGTAEDPWTFVFESTAGDVPSMTVVVKDQASSVLNGVAELHVSQNGQVGLGELQAVTGQGRPFRLQFNGAVTGVLEADATAEAVAAAIHELATLPAAEQRGLTVDGNGTDVSPWLVRFSEPGPRADFAVADGYLETTQTPDNGNDQTASLTLRLEGTSAGEFTFVYDGTDSDALEFRPTAQAITDALTNLLGNLATSVSVESVGNEQEVTHGGDKFFITLAGVAPGLDLGLLSIGSSGLTALALPSVAKLAAGVAYNPATPGTAEDKQQIRSKLSAGTFQLAFGNRTSSPLAFNASANDVRQALISMLGHDLVTVTDNGVAGGIHAWTVTFDSQLGQQPELQAFSAADRSQEITGFGGTVRNINRVVYGAGVNKIIGSNTTLESATDSFSELMSGAASFSDFLTSAFGTGEWAGSDTFTIGGNLLQVAKDWLIAQNSTLSSISAKVNESLPFLGSLVNSSLGPWYSGTVAPGTHLLDGLSGSDTYKFTGIWGNAAIVERPDAEVAGESATDCFDTLDLSGVDAETTIDVYRMALADVPGIEDILSRFDSLADDFPSLDVVANVMVVQDRALADQLSGFSLGAVNPADLFGGAEGNLILALDMENLVVGSGRTTIRLHGEASIRGTVAAGDDATIVLDYSDYTGQLDIDGEGGLQWEIIPPITLIPSFEIGPISVDAVEFPGLAYRFARASGIEGERLMGISQFADMLEKLGFDASIYTGFRSQDNAITSIAQVVLPNQTVSLDLAANEVEVDGTAWHASPTGSVTSVSLQGGMQQTLEMSANAGVWRLDYAGNLSVPLAFNATANQIADALNAMDPSVQFSVSGSGTNGDPWLVKRIANELQVADAGTSSASLVAQDDLRTHYELTFSSTDTITLAIGNDTRSVDVGDDALLATAVQELTGLVPTINPIAGGWDIVLGLPELTSNAPANLHANASTGIFASYTIDQVDQGLLFAGDAGSVLNVLAASTTPGDIQTWLDNHPANLGWDTTVAAGAGNWQVTLRWRPTTELTPMSSDVDLLGLPAIERVAGNPRLLPLNAVNSRYSLVGDVADLIEVSFRGNNSNVDMSQDIQTQFATVTGMHVVVESGDGTAADPYVIALSVPELTATNVTLGSTVDYYRGTFMFESPLPGDTVDFSFNGNTTPQVAGSVVDITWLQTELATIAGSDYIVEVTGDGSAPTPFEVTIRFADWLGVTGRLLNVDLPAASTDTGLANVPLIALGQGDQFVNATSGSDATILVGGNLQRSMLIGSAAAPLAVQLDAPSLTSNGSPIISVRHFGGVSVYYLDAERYLITLQSELVEQTDDALSPSSLGGWVAANFETDATGGESEADRLLAGMESFSTWSENLDTRLAEQLLNISLPFGNVDLSSLVPSFGAGDVLKGPVDDLYAATQDYLGSTSSPSVDGLLEYLGNNLLGGVTVTRTGAGLHEFQVEIEAASFDTSLSLDLGSWDFDNLGLGDLPFDLGLEISSDYELPISGAVTFSFVFGLSSQGDFFIQDPLVRAELSVGEDAFPVQVDENPTT
ncbi:MAG: DUF4347 domain-containing protein, partial [Planctomycetales bacterium]|nr:DUF4347 domain-containing protein [Planctomycetales bacterium]